MTDSRKAGVVLAMNTFAFMICFACWMMNAVLITFLTTNGIFDWDSSQVGMLLATPVLTGALLRLPVGMLTDRFGGRPVYTILMLLSAGALFLNSYAFNFPTFFASALGFGLSGASFAVGVGYTSVWFSREKQGTALGIFGTGNAGTAITLLFAPTMLKWLTAGGANPEGWRNLPRIYAAALVATAVVFWLFTYPRSAPGGAGKTLMQRLAPLAQVRVWRFGAYYFLLFGGFVALSNWLVPYYVKAYELNLATAGAFATMFSLPTGLMRAVGGWLSDRIGARSVMYYVLTVCCLATFALFFPRMDITTPGEGLQAKAPGTVVSASEKELVVKQARTDKTDTYKLTGSPPVVSAEGRDANVAVFPKSESWQTWSGVKDSQSGARRPFQAGDTIAMRQLLAHGSTHIYFQANVNIFTGLVLLLGLAMGIGMAAVYKHIPTYFPNDVGAIGGLVGVIGGLGGFVFPIIFGALLQRTGIWTTCWMLLFGMSVFCLAWMHIVLRGVMKQQAPGVAGQMDQPNRAAAGAA